jgi:hypothetical protein
VGVLNSGERSNFRGIPRPSLPTRPPRELTPRLPRPLLETGYEICCGTGIAGAPGLLDLPRFDCSLPLATTGEHGLT